MYIYIYIYTCLVGSSWTSTHMHPNAIAVLFFALLRPSSGWLLCVPLPYFALSFLGKLKLSQARQSKATSTGPDSTQQAVCIGITTVR